MATSPLIRKDHKSPSSSKSPSFSKSPSSSDFEGQNKPQEYSNSGRSLTRYSDRWKKANTYSDFTIPRPQAERRFFFLRRFLELTSLTGLIFAPIAYGVLIIVPPPHCVYSISLGSAFILFGLFLFHYVMTYKSGRGNEKKGLGYKLTFFLLFPLSVPLVALASTWQVNPSPEVCPNPLSGWLFGFEVFFCLCVSGCLLVDTTERFETMEFPEEAEDDSSKSKNTGSDRDNTGGDHDHDDTCCCPRIHSFEIIGGLMDMLPPLFWGEAFPVSWGFGEYIPYAALLGGLVLTVTLLVQENAKDNIFISDGSQTRKGLEDLIQFISDVVLLWAFFVIVRFGKTLRNWENLKPLEEVLEAEGRIKKSKWRSILKTPWFGFFLLIRMTFIHFSFQFGGSVSMGRAVYQVYWAFLSAVVLAVPADWIQHLHHLIYFLMDLFIARTDVMNQAKEDERQRDRQKSREEDAKIHTARKLAMKHKDREESNESTTAKPLELKPIEKEGIRKELDELVVSRITIDWVLLMRHLLNASLEFQSYWGPILLAVMIAAPVQTVVIGVYLSSRGSTNEVAGFVVSTIGFVFMISLLLFECCQISYWIAVVEKQITAVRLSHEMFPRDMPVKGLEVFGQTLNHSFLGAYVLTWGLSIIVTLLQN